jgi:hypothetical protein
MALSPLMPPLRQMNYMWDCFDQENDPIFGTDLTRAMLRDPLSPHASWVIGVMNCAYIYRHTIYTQTHNTNRAQGGQRAIHVCIHTHTRTCVCVCVCVYTHSLYHIFELHTIIHHSIITHAQTRTHRHRHRHTTHTTHTHTHTHTIPGSKWSKGSGTFMCRSACIDHGSDVPSTKHVDGKRGRQCF